MAVIVENAGFGAAAAAPLARRVFDYWLLGHYPSEQDLAAMRRGQATAPQGIPRRAADMLGEYERIDIPGLAVRALPWVAPAGQGAAAVAAEASTAADEEDVQELAEVPMSEQ